MGDDESSADEGQARDWNLTYYLHCTAAEAERIYDAFQVLLCSCQDHGDGETQCRVPFSGMKSPTLITEGGES